MFFKKKVISFFRKTTNNGANLKKNDHRFLTWKKKNFSYKHAFTLLSKKFYLLIFHFLKGFILNYYVASRIFIIKEEKEIKIIIKEIKKKNPQRSQLKISLMRKTENGRLREKELFSFSFRFYNLLFKFFFYIKRKTA